MALPTLRFVQPAAGPSSGGDLVRLVGTGFASQVQVLFASAPADVLSVHQHPGQCVADLRTPSQAPGLVDVTLSNLDAAGNPVPGESALLAGAYRFSRSAVAGEADLTRVVRQLLRLLKRQVLANVSTTVSVDYDDATLDGLNVIAMAKVPSLVLSGPTLRPNRFYSVNVAHEHVISGISGPQFVRHEPPYTVDLVFTVTGVSSHTAQLLNLESAVLAFLNRNRWLQLARDPTRPSRGVVRWELDADGEVRTTLTGRDDLRAFSCGLVVRGFDIDDTHVLDTGPVVLHPELQTHSLPPGGIA